jgi:hypothetical protein
LREIGVHKINRIVRAVAEAAAAPREPSIDRFYFRVGGAHPRSATIPSREVKSGEMVVVTDPDKYAEARVAGTTLPSNHSPWFAPDVDPSLHTAITAEIAVLRDLLNAPEELHKLTSVPPAP